jgi:hypothetical protein
VDNPGVEAVWRSTALRRIATVLSRDAKLRQTMLFVRVLDRENTPETAKLRLIMPCYIPRKSFIDLTGPPDKAHDR